MPELPDKRKDAVMREDCLAEWVGLGGPWAEFTDDIASALDAAARIRSSFLRPTDETVEPAVPTRSSIAGPQA